MKRMLTGLLIAGLSLHGALAHEIESEVDASTPAAFDIVKAGATTDGRLMTFVMEVAGQAGSSKPVPIGQLAGAKVESYVWPTSLDPAVVGFDAGSGILALAITAHPDFDDTPSSTRTATAIPPMTAPSGTRTGWCWSRTTPAAPASRSVTCRRASICCRTPRRTCLSRWTARA